MPATMPTRAGANQIDVILGLAHLGDMPSLGEFLRSMRGRRQPTSAAPAGRRPRRTPGMRREEVAELAGVSTDWYTRLEQDRADRPSSAVLDAVGRALELTAAERRYLFRLAGHADPKPPRPIATAHPSLVAAIDAMPTTPALLLGARFDVLAANPLGDALFLGFGGHPGDFARNAAWMTFCDPRAPALFPDHRAVMRDTVGVIRSAFARQPLDPGFLELIRALSAGSPDFVALWSTQHVAEKGVSRKRFAHPVGLLDLAVHTMTAPDADQLLVFYLPRDPQTAARLPRLVAAPARRARATASARS